jgi:hypothetical protein
MAEQTEPITHVTETTVYCWKTCQCTRCGITKLCTPDFDFFKCDLDPKTAPRPLHCFNCLVIRMNCDTDKVISLPESGIKAVKPEFGE